MKTYIIAAALFATAAFAQTPAEVAKYTTAEPVDVVVTAKRPVVKKDAAPRKSKVSTEQKTITPTKTTK